VQHAVDRLRELGHVYEADGALWLRSTAFGDDKDRPIIRSNGEPAYIAGDLAYYLNKRERGFDRVMIILGADHHGYIGRMMAMCAAFATPPGHLEILIGQMVTLTRDGQPVRLSKRAGTVITLEDLVEAVGVDAARTCWPARRSTRPWTSIWTCGPGAPTTTRSSTCSTRMRESPGWPQRDGGGVRIEDGFDPALLEHDTRPCCSRARRVPPGGRAGRRTARATPGGALPRGAGSPLPPLVRRVPGDAAGEEPVTDLHRTRLWLAVAARTVLENGLHLLGVSAPERM